MNYTNTLESTCHCGNIHIALHTNHSSHTLSPRNCQCTLCKKHQASWISDPKGSACVTIKDQNATSFYRFGLKTADFIICKNCGVLMIAVCEIKGTKRAVINSTPMLNTVFAATTQTNFNGEDTASRMQRRERNWTANVTIETLR